MKTSTITAEFAAPPAQVWAIVTDQQNTGWRSDLDRVEVVSDTEFVEYTKRGFATHFRITDIEPVKTYAFSMENQNFTGEWRRDLFRNISRGLPNCIYRAVEDEKTDDASGCTRLHESPKNAAKVCPRSGDCIRA
ncbi:hypothetical protein CLOSTMETH_02622 [[Clostridium] methylpentosum DSM 5476]|uniref:Polyketide cyclase/dehydrase n=1 Tax=[Clostridium] methylpentosum DSM 5476 TaxID=537013 RepID=C0EFI0_9FIRM|nr:hypothetical protein CLOSTMETH_02622 [[Clostridium] methylpentosum DSM 5476]